MQKYLLCLAVTFFLYLLPVIKLAQAYLPFTQAYTTLSNPVLSESDRMTVTFQPKTSLSSGDLLILKIEATKESDKWNDGQPDGDGFDSSKLPTDLLYGPGCGSNKCFSASNFSVSTVYLYSQSGMHTITIKLNQDINTYTVYSFVLGHNSNKNFRFINPSGRSDQPTYTIRLSSQNSPQTITYDDTIMKVRPVDGVKVSANVEVSLNYTINGIDSGTTIPACKTNSAFITSISTSATKIPFGNISLADNFYNAAQTHTVSTNNINGYILTVSYDHPLASGSTIIDDGRCDGSCNADIYGSWNSRRKNGFAYTLGNIKGEDADFTSTNGFKTFALSPKLIMSKSAPTDASQIATCYRLSINKNQQTGYYSNKLIFTAMAKF